MSNLADRVKATWTKRRYVEFLSGIKLDQANYDLTKSGTPFHIKSGRYEYIPNNMNYDLDNLDLKTFDKSFWTTPIAIINRQEEEEPSLILFAAPSDKNVSVAIELEKLPKQKANGFSMSEMHDFFKRVLSIVDSGGFDELKLTSDPLKIELERRYEGNRDFGLFA